MTAIAPSPPGVGMAGRQGFIAALGIGQICSWGALYYAFPLIAEQIEGETGWSRTSLYGAATAGLLIAAAASFPLGRAIDRGHGRFIMTGGSVLAGLVMLAWSQVSDLVGLYVIVGLLGVLQAATLYEAAFAVAARRFGAAGARDAIVAVTLWAGFASTVFIPLIQLMIDLWGWRGAVAALGVINLVVCAGLYGWAIRPERDMIQRELAGPQETKSASGVRQAMASPVFWSLTLAYTAHAAVFTAFTFHLYPLLLERGFETAAIIAAMAVIGPGQVGGRIAMTIFAGNAPMRVVGSWVVAGFALSLALLVWLPPSFAAIVAVVALYSVTNGILTIVRGASIPEMVSRQDYGAISGVMNTPATVARALAPLGAAALWSVNSTYDPVLVAMLAGAIMLAAGFWVAAGLGRREKR